MAGGTGLEDVDDTLGRGGEVGRTHGEGIAGVGGDALGGKQVVEREPGHADATFAQKPAAGLEGGVFLTDFVIHLLKKKKISFC